MEGQDNHRHVFFHAGDARPADEEGDGLEQVDQFCPGSCLALPAATIDIDMVLYEHCVCQPVNEKWTCQLRFRDRMIRDNFDVDM